MPPSRSLVLVVLAVALAAVYLPSLPQARAGTAVILSEDFESGPIPAAWDRSDGNAASGLDYWDVTNYRAHAGTYSAWGAQIGTQSDTGFNNSAVHQYDDDMRADLVVNLSVNGYTSLTLSFYYYSRAESGGGDFLQAWYEANATQTVIFTNTGGTGNKWDLASVAVPNDVERLIIRFQTDAANHGFEGAYVDDILLTGTEDTPPWSSVSPLPAFTNAYPFPAPYVAVDNENASGVAYVELWWRNATSGPFSLYTRPSNPLGQWTTPTIPFYEDSAAGEGYYEFYTVAVDNAANREAPPAGPDAAVTVDRTAPTLAVTTPADGAWVAGSTVTATWTATDAIAGLDHYEAAIDGGLPASTGLTATAQFPGLADGAHSVLVRAFDRAGNMRTVTVGFAVDTELPLILTTAPADGAWFSDADVVVRWEGSDAVSGVDRYETGLDGGAFDTNGILNETVFADLPDGFHNVTVRAHDRAGNAATATVMFAVDTTPPTIAVTAPADRKVVRSTSLTARWTAGDATSGIERFEVWIDSGVHRNTTATALAFTGLRDGVHTLHVRAIDRVGNANETVVTFLVETDFWSWEGPYGPFPLLLLILVVLAAFIGILFWWKRRKERDSEATPDSRDGDAAEEPEPDEGAEDAPEPLEGEDTEPPMPE